MRCVDGDHLGIIGVLSTMLSYHLGADVEKDSMSKSSGDF